MHYRQDRRATGSGRSRPASVDRDAKGIVQQPTTSAGWFR
ncbi:hypothetical protein SAMN05216285_1119 [Natrinema salifodinae]|uniref:Uncharacterized protein n=1 Tax=Natrinema salifodinae TaxID=1202768 RepID=A0A1I0MMK4_9EURY|nr:hypothetical protein SAMN05216285_1119 [Natrinema salifodinae]